MTPREEFLSAIEEKTTHTISEFSTTFSEDAKEDSDFVNHPQHYRPGTYEAINVIREWGLNFALGNAVKYICRAGRKDPSKQIEDLEKAIFYIQNEVETLKNQK